MAIKFQIPPREAGNGLFIGGLVRPHRWLFRDSIYVEESCGKVSIRVSRGDAK